MKIGLISDIHGEFDSLKLALDMLRGRGVDHILCAGDLIDKGPQSNAVARRIRDDAIPCVQGNHDAEASVRQIWLRKEANEAMLRELGWWLDIDVLAYVAALPLTLHFEWDGVRVCLAHGAPWSNMVYVFDHRPQSALDLVVEEAQADVVVLGHTHDPMRIPVGEALIVNPGSVCGRESFGSHTCAILTLPERTFTVYSLRTGDHVTPSDGTVSEW